MRRLIALALTVLTIPAAFADPIRLDRRTEAAVFQALLGELNRIKLDFDGSETTLTEFLSSLLKNNPRSLMSLSNECTVRNGPDDFICDLKLTLYKRTSRLAEKASYQVLYRTTGNVEQGVSFDPSEAAVGASGRGLRNAPEYESLALQQFLGKMTHVNMSGTGQEPLPEFLAEDLLNRSHTVSSVRHRCQAVDSLEKPECALSFVIYRTTKRGLPIESVYSLKYNAGTDKTYGIALPGRIMSATLVQ